jgi:trans-2-enoyl-CoA reductase
MPKVSAIVFHQHGAPAEVVRVEEIEVPEPLPDEARVRVLAAPINPADLNTIEGTYPIRPALPGVPGVEGVAEVEAVGADVDQVRVGDRVLLPHGFGSWRAAGVAKAADLRVVPPGIAVEQAAMLKINPATALRMLRDFASLAPGDWVLQNAANSAVGRAVIQIAHATGLRTINVVRRPELVPELQALGADAVLVESEDLRGEISAATTGAPLRLALNAVGGESALRLANALAPGGTVVTYGAMSRKPLRIPNGLLIFKDQRWRGFWVSQWYRQASPEACQTMFAELFALAQRGVIHAPVERIYPLEEAVAALAHAAHGGRAGKILFGAPEFVSHPSSP